MPQTDTKSATPAEIEIQCHQCGEVFLVPTGEDGRPLRLLCGGCSGGGMAVRSRRPVLVPPPRND
jgi:formylmethanofuran dehydrogenase subunit E